MKSSPPSFGHARSPAGAGVALSLCVPVQLPAACQSVCWPEERHTQPEPWVLLRLHPVPSAPLSAWDGDDGASSRGGGAMAAGRLLAASEAGSDCCADRLPAPTSVSPHSHEFPSIFCTCPQTGSSLKSLSVIPWLLLNPTGACCKQALSLVVSSFHSVLG